MAFVTSYLVSYVSPPFLLWQIHVWTTQLVYLLILDGHLGCFHLLTTVSRAAVSDTCLSPCFQFLWVYLPGHVVILGFCLRDTSVCFPQGLHLCTLSPAMQDGSGFSTAVLSTAPSFPFLLITGKSV